MPGAAGGSAGAGGAGDLATMRLRYFVLPSLFAVGVPICVLAPSSFVSNASPGDGWLLLLVIIAFLYLLLSIASAAAAIVLTVWKQWQGAACCVILPLFAGAFLLRPTLLRYLSVSDELRYALSSAHYAQVVASLPATADPKMVWFFWRDASGFLSGETLEYLVYDQSDGFAQATDNRSVAWKASVAKTYPGTPEEGVNGSARHIFGHYYVVYVGD